MKKSLVVILSIIMLVAISFTLVACTGSKYNVSSVSCTSARGEYISFNLPANWAYHEEGHSWFVDGSVYLTSMVEKLREKTSITYDYQLISRNQYDTNPEVCYIFNRSTSKPATFMLRTTTVEGKDGFEFFAEVAPSQINQKLAFPVHMLQDAIAVEVNELFVEYGSAFVVDGDIDDIKSFYEKNNYSVVVNGSILEVTDNLGYSGGDNRFKIEVEEISQGKNLMTFVRFY